MSLANIKEVTINDYLNKDFNEAVFCRLDTLDYNVRMDGKKSNKNDFYTNPKKYKSTFMKYVAYTDIFIAGHFHDSNAPYLFTRDDIRSNDFNITVVADISCDIDGL